MSAMPAQLSQVASAMGYISTDKLGEDLRNGTVSMDEFMNTIVRLNKDGTGEFKSFEEQAKNSTGGIATSITVAKTQVVKGVTDIINSIDTALKDNGLGGISEIVSTMGVSMKEALDKVAEVLGNLITKLAELYNWATQHQDLLIVVVGIIGTLTVAIIAYTIAQNAATIAVGIYNGVITLATTVSAVFGAVMAFITSPITLVILVIGALVVAIVLLIKHWDEVKEVALKVWEMIKTAVSNAIELVKKKFEEMKTKIIEIFNKVISAVTTWISNMKAKAVEGVKNICDRIMSTFRELPNKVKEVGSNIVHGLWNGIVGLKDWVVEKVKGMGSEVINSLKNVLGIHSPSTVFAEIGKNTILGFGKGFSNNAKKVFNELSSAVEQETSKLNNKLGLNATIDRNINLSNTLDTIEQDRNINVNANTYLDGRKIATSVNSVNARNRLAYGIGG